MRLKLILASMLVASSVAHGQQNIPTEYQIKVTPQELDLIGKGVGLLPFNDVAPLVQKLRSQVFEQQQPPKPVMPPAAAPEIEKK